MLRRSHTHRMILPFLVLLVITTAITIYIHHFHLSLLVHNNILIFILISTNFISLMILIAWVFRNLLRVSVEPRSIVREIRFRTKLITAFANMALIPSVLLFLFASGLLSTSIEHWFNSEIETSLQDSLGIAQSYVRTSETNALSFGTELSQLITDHRLLLSVNAESLQHTMRKKRQEFLLHGVQVYRADILGLATTFDRYVPREVAEHPFPSQLQAGFQGHTQSYIISLGNGDVLRGIVPIWAQERATVEVAIVVTYYLPRGLITKRQRILRTLR